MTQKFPKFPDVLFVRREEYDDGDADYLAEADYSQHLDNIDDSVEVGVYKLTDIKTVEGSARIV